MLIGRLPSADHTARGQGRGRRRHSRTTPPSSVIANGRSNSVQPVRRGDRRSEGREHEGAGAQHRDHSRPCRLGRADATRRTRRIPAGEGQSAEQGEQSRREEGEQRPGGAQPASEGRHEYHPDTAEGCEHHQHQGLAPAGGRRLQDQQGADQHRHRDRSDPAQVGLAVQGAAEHLDVRLRRHRHGDAATARTSATTAAASRPLMSATTSTLRMTWSCTMEPGSGATSSLATSPRRTCSPEGVSTLTSSRAERLARVGRRSQDHHVEDLGLLVEVADRQARSQGGCLAPDVPRPQPVALGGSEVDLDPDGRLHGAAATRGSARRPRRRGRRDGLCGSAAVPARSCPKRGPRGPGRARWWRRRPGRPEYVLSCVLTPGYCRATRSMAARVEP